MKKYSKYILICIFLVIQIFSCTACTINIQRLVARDYPEYEWYCEELDIICLKESAFAMMEYNGREYTKAYYESLTKKIENVSREDTGKIYPSISGFVDYDGNFYLRYSEHILSYGEDLNDYYWSQTNSYDILSGDVKKRGDCISVEVELDELYNGKYIGKTITFEKR